MTQVMAHLAGEYEVVLVAGSDGRLAADIRPLVRVSMTVIVEGEGGKREQGSSGGGGRTGYDFFTDEVLREYARAAVHQAVTNLGARPAPAGKMPVVLGPGWPRHPAARSGGARPGRRFSIARAVPPSRGRSESASRPRASPSSTTEPSPAGAALSTSTTRATRRSAPC